MRDVFPGEVNELRAITVNGKSENLNKDTYQAAEKYLLIEQLEPRNPGLQKQTLPLCVCWQKTAPLPLSTSLLNGNVSWLSMQLGRQPE